MKTGYIQVPVDETFRLDDGTEIVCREDPAFEWRSMCEGCPLLSKNHRCVRYFHNGKQGRTKEDDQSNNRKIINSHESRKRSFDFQIRERIKRLH